MKNKISVNTRHESNLKIDVLWGQFVQLNLVCFILCYTVEINQIPVFLDPVLKCSPIVSMPHRRSTYVIQVCTISDLQ